MSRRNVSTLNFLHKVHSPIRMDGHFFRRTAHRKAARTNCSFLFFVFLLPEHPLRKSSSSVLHTSTTASLAKAVGNKYFLNRASMSAAHASLLLMRLSSM